MTLYNKTKKVCGILYSKIFLNYKKKKNHDVGLSPVTLTLSVEVESTWTKLESCINQIFKKSHNVGDLC
jgi:hypothetical protein